MAVNINTNLSAMIAQRNLTDRSRDVETSVERLSSGSRINSAKDDVAGFSMSNRLVVQNRAFDVAINNANNGISTLQTAEGALNVSTSILQNMRDLSLQSANGSNSDADREAIQQEFSKLNTELNRIANNTTFSGTKLLDGSYGTKSLQIGSEAGVVAPITIKDMRSNVPNMGGMIYVGSNEKSDKWELPGDATEMVMTLENTKGVATDLTISAKAGDNIEELATYINGHQTLVRASVNESGQMQIFAGHDLGEGNVSFSGNLANELGLSDGEKMTVNDADISTPGGAQKAIGIIDTALKYVDNHRAELGASQNQLDYIINNINNMNENVATSKGRIKDTDFAKETTAMTKSQILQEASTTVLAQAKGMPGQAINLLS